MLFALPDSIRFSCMLAEIYQLLRLAAILPLPFSFYTLLPISSSQRQPRTIVLYCSSYGGGWCIEKRGKRIPAIVGYAASNSNTKRSCSRSFLRIREIELLPCRRARPTSFSRTNYFVKTRSYKIALPPTTKDTTYRFFILSPLYLIVAAYSRQDEKTCSRKPCIGVNSRNTRPNGFSAIDEITRR